MMCKWISLATAILFVSNATNTTGTPTPTDASSPEGVNKTSASNSTEDAKVVTSGKKARYLQPAPQPHEVAAQKDLSMLAKVNGANQKVLPAKGQTGHSFSPLPANNAASGQAVYPGTGQQAVVAGNPGAVVAGNGQLGQAGVSNAQPGQSGTAAGNQPSQVNAYLLVTETVPVPAPGVQPASSQVAAPQIDQAGHTGAAPHAAGTQPGQIYTPPVAADAVNGQPGRVPQAAKDAGNSQQGQASVTIVPTYAGAASAPAKEVGNNSGAKFTRSLPPKNETGDGKSLVDIPLANANISANTSTNTTQKRDAREILLSTQLHQLASADDALEKKTTVPPTGVV